MKIEASDIVERIRVEDWIYAKPKLMDVISQSEEIYVRGNHSQISGTNYFLNNTRIELYGETMGKIMYQVVTYLGSQLKACQYNPSSHRMWHQRYQSGDWHDWHAHPTVNMSGVLYVSLPEGSSPTQFKIGDQIYTPEVTEGEVIVFPSCIRHRSPPTQHEGEKVIISFNMDMV